MQAVAIGSGPTQRYYVGQSRSNQEIADEMAGKNVNTTWPNPTEGMVRAVQIWMGDDVRRPGIDYDPEDMKSSRRFFSSH